MNLEAKNRMVSCRLTAEEYKRLRDLSSVIGVRSVSELARVAISELLQQPIQEPRRSLESRVSELEGQVQTLSLDIRKLRGRSS